MKYLNFSYSISHFISATYVFFEALFRSVKSNVDLVASSSKRTVGRPRFS